MSLTEPGLASVSLLPELAVMEQIGVPGALTPAAGTPCTQLELLNTLPKSLLPDSEVSLIQKLKENSML